MYLFFRETRKAEEDIDILCLLFIVLLLIILLFWEEKKEKEKIQKKLLKDHLEREVS